MLQVNQVSKSFGTVAALKAVSLDVATGETMALIGPSGCGKSTLLRVMIGLATPDDGMVTVVDEPLGTGDALRRQQRRMGYVIQSGGLFPISRPATTSACPPALQGGLRTGSANAWASSARWSTSHPTPYAGTRTSSRAANGNGSA